MSSVTRTERGWGAHFIRADRCLFRRNTLLEKGTTKIVVSTVGALISEGKMEEIGPKRYYETLAFAGREDGLYIEACTSKNIPFKSKWCINADSVEALPEYVDLIANKQHEDVVEELTSKLERSEELV